MTGQIVRTVRQEEKWRSDSGRIQGYVGRWPGLAWKLGIEPGGSTGLLGGSWAPCLLLVRDGNGGGGVCNAQKRWDGGQGSGGHRTGQLSLSLLPRARGPVGLLPWLLQDGTLKRLL